MACAPLDGPPGCLRANGLVPGRARTPADTFPSRGHRLLPSSSSVLAAAWLCAAARPVTGVSVDPPSLGEPGTPGTDRRSTGSPRDDDRLDDPTAAGDPAAVRPAPAGVRIHLEDVEFLAVHGASWDEVQTRTGACRNSIEVACARAGRPDLVARITNNRRVAA